ncbi:MAG: FtsQ-type POTRA domain-containing protein [Anaerolineaceae bacterium]|nr:FtsQ-type POTRA domain-containing protein [Anaerolineaceae bacterium]
MASRYENMTRADQVRARRTIEPARRKPIPQPDKYSKRNAESSARVTVRRADLNMAKPSSAAYTQHRRKFYVPSENSGTEIGLPSLPMVRLSWRLASALLAILAGIGIYLVSSSPTFMVSAINLSGAMRVSAQEILDTIDLEGTQIIKITPDQIKEKIVAAFPDIDSAEVAVAFPAVVNVSVNERIPAITWVENDTPLFWVDEKGYTFPVRGEASIPLVVHASGEPPRPLGYLTEQDAAPAGEAATPETPAAPTPSVDPQFVEMVLKLRPILPPGTALLYSAENGLGWTDPNGWQVFLGTDPEDIDMKLAEYQVIVADLLERNLQPVLINLEYLHAPYYRLEH